MENDEEVVIKSNDLVTVTKMNHITEIQYMEKQNRKQVIQKISKDEYVNLETGEIGQFQKTENRSQSYSSLKKTFKNMRYLINNNFLGGKNELHLVLTYGENMTDPTRLYTDVEKFIKRLRYRFRNQSKIEYIAVVEPQERGAWHVHLLLKFVALDSVFIPVVELSDIWGHGFVFVTKIEGVDNIGAYLTAYLSDVELTNENMLNHRFENHEVVQKEIKEETKAFVKGGRLHMYPSGMNIYRNSRGIKHPERKVMKYKNAKKIIGNTTPDYSRTYKVETEDFENIISFEQYNTKRL